VDLKLKHNTVIDSRKTLHLTQSIKQSTAQTQNSAEQTTRLAEKADKEGSTILVFTVVTIIFVSAPAYE
jgi:predicted ATP-dependent serine protease